MKFVDNIKKEEYDSFVKSHNKSHFLQSYAWGEFNKEARGLTPYYVGVKNDKNKLICATLLLKKSLPLGYSYFYAPRGFVIDFMDFKLVEYFTKKVASFVKMKKGIFFKIDPDIVISKKNYKDEDIPLDYDYKKIFSMLKKLGYHHLGFTKNFETSQPRYSFRIDMNQSLEEIENKFSKTTKQRIKKAKKFEVETYIGNESDVEVFYNLMLLTEDRKNFVSPNLDYYKKLYNIYNKDNKMTIYIGKVDLDKIIKKVKIELKTEEDILEKLNSKDNLSKSENTKKNESLKRKEKLSSDLKRYEEIQKEYGSKIILNAHVLLDYGDKTWVVYAANHNILTDTYSNYLTYDYHIRTSYENNIKMYDQFGTVGDLENKKYIGLHEFKKKFGGDYVEFIGEFDYITNKVMYFLFTKLVPIYRKIVKKHAKEKVQEEVSKRR